MSTAIITPLTGIALLDAAIAKLTDQRDAAIFGPWQHGNAIDDDTAPGEVFFDGSAGPHVVATTDPDYGNADLIVTLHALIDPTLTLLQLERAAVATGALPRQTVTTIATTIMEGPLL